MLARAHTRPSARPGSEALLRQLARILVEAAVADDADAPDATHDTDDTGLPGHLVAIVGPLAGTDTAAFDLLLRRLDGHPADVLLGFVAPPEWSAVGVVITATARPLDTSAQPSRPPRPLDQEEHIVFAYLVARDGVSVSVSRRPDGSRWETSATSLDETATGRVDDALRRVLGLPTHPPPADPAELWARLWLDRVLTEVGARPSQPWSWPTIAVLHPAAKLVIDDMRGRVSEVVEAMPRLAEILARGRTWDDLRLGYVSGQWDAPSIPSDVARWMDDGIFSRWLLDSVPPCGAALVALRDLLPSSLVTRIERTLDRWHVSTSVADDTWPWSPRLEHRR